MMKKFRLTIDNHINDENKNLSKNQPEFTDQGHYIKHFKRFTDLTPKVFFNRTQQLDKSVWIKID